MSPSTDAHDIPAELRYQARTIIDTKGSRPDISFLAVPETKTVKNRVHLDVRVGRAFPREERHARQDAEARRLVAAGATLIGRVDTPDGTSHLVLRDVEGNEFCVT
ncbi:VOC family protein [Actinobacteria bacterium YIM 96077]|uniref:VOC family protein n=1 Tax=Phytoactinopolyspora halophila TaxID=1981511 RepID=A0A329QNS6_9ACTN|nr:VOC family protein [Phytoactinopolyspora halophila]AYY14596.1 VOC family protein [Actinobacteria bacterium YIM 96077]RAW14027.1 VOC family protein [Phytoactinopolyspora halophila]